MNSSMGDRSSTYLCRCYFQYTEWNSSNTLVFSTNLGSNSSIMRHANVAIVTKPMSGYFSQQSIVLYSTIHDSIRIPTRWLCLAHRLLNEIQEFWHFPWTRFNFFFHGCLHFEIPSELFCLEYRNLKTNQRNAIFSKTDRYFSSFENRKILIQF